MALQPKPQKLKTKLELKPQTLTDGPKVETKHSVGGHASRWE
eukprot:CAMPEP_0184328086 /NCGR_PEP_ID=MMETSP1049-20130417/143435_1 /TAXON_ID=77928 /ORGANISM="Proteomonas sulcata, Strain CCMP704" /LENGTH=41 /DNA_ID= /DNA_START= /DNA_END= /DNA_ORIENTATION=